MLKAVFSKKLVDKLREVLGEEYAVGEVNMGKCVDLPNGLILIRKKGSVAAPAVKVDKLYNEFLRGKSLSEIVELVLKHYLNDDELPKGLYETDIRKFDSLKDKIGFRLVNIRRNTRMLEMVPHVLYLDMAVVFFLKIAENCTLTVTKELMECWNTDSGALFELAKQNMPVLYPMECEYAEGKSEKAEIKSTFPDMYFMTNAKDYYGAATILYEGSLKEMADKVKDDLYIILCDTCMAVIFRASECEKEMMRFAAFGLGSTVFGKDSFLSDSLYMYRRDTDKLKIVE